MKRRRRKRYTDTQKAQHVEKAVYSGNMYRYARAHKIGYSTLCRWKKKYLVKGGKPVSQRRHKHKPKKLKITSAEHKHLVLVSKGSELKPVLFETQEEAKKHIRMLIQRGGSPAEITYFEKAPYQLKINIMI